MQNGNDVVVPRQAVTMGNTATIGWYEINRSTGESIGVTENGGHQGLVGWAAILGVAAVLLNWASPRLRALVADFQAYVNLVGYYICLAPFAIVDSVVKGAGQGIGIGVVMDWAHEGLRSIIKANIAFTEAVFSYLGPAYRLEFEEQKQLGVLKFIYALDPPVPGMLMQSPTGELQDNIAVTQAKVAPGLTAGTLTGTVQAPSTVASQELAANWTTQSTSSSFSVQALTAAGATITDANGNAVGTGMVGLSATAGVPVAIQGGASFSLNGQGRLSFYAPAASGLGVSGEWNSYTAGLSGTWSFSSRQVPSL